MDNFHIPNEAAVKYPFIVADSESRMVDVLLEEMLGILCFRIYWYHTTVEEHSRNVEFYGDFTRKRNYSFSGIWP